MLTPDGPIGNDTSFTGEFVIGVVVALMAVVVWVLKMSQSYVRRDVLAPTLKAYNNRLNRIERKVLNGSYEPYTDDDEPEDDG